MFSSRLRARRKQSQWTWGRGKELELPISGPQHCNVCCKWARGSSLCPLVTCGFQVVMWSSSKLGKSYHSCSLVISGDSPLGWDSACPSTLQPTKALQRAPAPQASSAVSIPSARNTLCSFQLPCRSPHGPLAKDALQISAASSYPGSC